MRICDGCKKPIPMGEMDRIDVDFNGKFGRLMKKIHGDSQLTFCSLKCFNDFKVSENKEALK